MATEHLGMPLHLRSAPVLGNAVGQVQEQGQALEEPTGSPGQPGSLLLGMCKFLFLKADWVLRASWLLCFASHET